MNITDYAFSILPAQIKRKNKCFNLVVTKDVVGNEEHVKIGYQNTSVKGKTEVFCCTDRPMKNDGFRKAVMLTMHQLLSDGTDSMLYVNPTA